MQIDYLLSKIKPPHGSTRRSAILLWCFSSSFFLYYFSLASSINEKSLLFGYLNFAALLFGGGMSYHVLVELLQIKQNEKNEWAWRALFKHLLILQAGYLAAGITIYTGITLGGVEGFTLALFSLVIGYFWVLHYLIISMKKIKKIFGIRWFDKS